MDGFEFDEESYDELSDGEIEEGFELDEIMAEAHKDVEKAIHRLKEMVSKPNSVFAAQAAVELVQLDPSVDSLKYLVKCLEKADSYHAVQYLDAGLSHFCKDKQPSELELHIKWMISCLSSHQRLRLRLQCTLISIYIELEEINQAKELLFSTKTEISATNAVWKDIMYHEVGFLDVQIQSIEAESSLTSFIELQQTLGSLGKTGIAVNAQQKQILSQIRARVNIKNRNLAAALPLLTPVSMFPNCVLCTLLSLCLEQQNFEIPEDSPKILSELIHSWHSLNTLAVESALYSIKQMLMKYRYKVGVSSLISETWERYREHKICVVLRHYSRIRFDRLLNMTSDIFNSEQELQKKVYAMIRYKKLSCYRINSYESSLDKVDPLNVENKVLDDEHVSVDVDELLQKALINKQL